MGIETNKSDMVLEDFGSFFDDAALRLRMAIETNTGHIGIIAARSSPGIADITKRIGMQARGVMEPWMIKATRKK